MNRLKHLWSNLHESFWFLPALIVAFCTALAVGLIEVDSSGSQDWMEDWPRLFGAGAAGARGILATIAGSMMTVVGVTFSMTLVGARSPQLGRRSHPSMNDNISSMTQGWTGPPTWICSNNSCMRKDRHQTA